VKRYKKWYLGVFIIAVLALLITGCKPTESSETTLEDESGSAEESVFSAVYPPEEELEPIILDGAITSESGLQFLEVIPGEGDHPQEGEVISMHFIITLPDGTELGNTHLQGGEPLQSIMGRGQLLPGWEEGVSLMRPGGKAKFVLPPELAFGESGYQMVPPNSEILLEIELVSIVPAPIPSSISDVELTTTESGLQYADLTIGDGTEALDGYTVSTHFSLWVQDDPGTIFITTSDDQGPVTFKVGGGDMVFPGWEEGVFEMKVGGKRLLVIPPELAFGAQGNGDIPPNATLIMEIELLDAIEPIIKTDIDEDDFTITDSGLKYFDILEGDGPIPETGQTVIVHYTGWLEDGTQFDSSLDRGQPFSFVLGTGGVIAGWDEGVLSMKVGGKRQLVIPPDLGYGDTGAGSFIPPGATLIFEVELLDIQE